jgi:hypothetical protein
MKITSKLLLICFLFFACSASKKTSGENELMMQRESVKEQFTAKTYKVSGSVMKSGAFCGGARMPNDVLAEITKPKPQAIKKMYVKKGKENIFSEPVFLEFITDSLGKFSISLPPGTYCIIDEFKLNRSNYEEILKKYEKETQYYSAVDPVCLEGWFKMADLLVEVTAADQQNADLIYAGTCSWNAIPCVMYTGPLPP